MVKTDSPKDPGVSSKAGEVLLQQIKRVLNQLRSDLFSKFNRHVSINDLLSDRWETARFYGFGEGTSCYNNVLILGDVKVGKNTWIDPNVVLDGSGGLEIGSYVSVSCGVQIRTHHTVEWSASLGKSKPAESPRK